jgi:CBS domain-containing protein
MVGKVAVMKRIEELMQRNVKTLDRNDDLAEANTVMRTEQIRHLPVLNDSGRLVGIVSQRDLMMNALVRALGFGTTARDRAYHSVLVKDVMTEEVVTAPSATPVDRAAQIMSERKIGCLPVVDGDQLVGIVTETDLLAAVARGEL